MGEGAGLSGISWSGGMKLSRDLKRCRRPVIPDSCGVISTTGSDEVIGPSVAVEVVATSI
jgi:hypothetical protein